MLANPPAGLPPIKAAPEPAPAPAPLALIDATPPDPALPPPAEPARWLAALAPVRQRQAESIATRVADGDADPLRYAHWVREYRIALRQAGASESEAQEVAQRENAALMATLREAALTGARLEVRARVLHLMGGA